MLLTASTRPRHASAIDPSASERGICAKPQSILYQWQDTHLLVNRDAALQQRLDLIRRDKSCLQHLPLGAWVPSAISTQARNRFLTADNKPEPRCSNTATCTSCQNRHGLSAGWVQHLKVLVVQAELRDTKYALLLLKFADGVSQRP